MMRCVWDFTKWIIKLHWVHRLCLTTTTLNATEKRKQELNVILYDMVFVVFLNLIMESDWFYHVLAMKSTATYGNFTEL